MIYNAEHLYYIAAGEISESCSTTAAAAAATTSIFLLSTFSLSLIHAIIIAQHCNGAAATISSA